MKNIILFFFLFGLCACSNSAVEEELKNVKNELIAATSTIENLKSQIEPEGELVHLVFFNLKPEVDQKALGTEIKKLEGIAEVKDLQFGPFENLGDARALSEYDLMMEMSFDNAAAYQKYQAHPIHLKLKENVKTLLEAPPATYDYLKK